MDEIQSASMLMLLPTLSCHPIQVLLACDVTRCRLPYAYDVDARVQFTIKWNTFPDGTKVPPGDSMCTGDRFLFSAGLGCSLSISLSLFLALSLFFCLLSPSLSRARRIYCPNKVHLQIQTKRVLQGEGGLV